MTPEPFFALSQMAEKYFLCKSQFNINHLLAHMLGFIWPLGKTLTGATILNQSGPGGKW